MVCSNKSIYIIAKMQTLQESNKTIYRKPRLLPSKTYRRNGVTVVHRLVNAEVYEKVQYYRQTLELMVAGKLLWQGFVFNCNESNRTYEHMVGEHSNTTDLDIFGTLLYYLPEFRMEDSKKLELVHSIMTSMPTPMARSEMRVIIDGIAIKKYSNFVDAPKEVLEQMFRQFLYSGKQT
jgi:hypothetical protein